MTITDDGVFIDTFWQVEEGMPRRKRRSFVLRTYLAAAVTVGAFIVGEIFADRGSSPIQFAPFVELLPFGGAYLAFGEVERSASGWLFKPLGMSLNADQVAVRDRAYRHAYGLIISMAPVLLFLVLVLLFNMAELVRHWEDDRVGAWLVPVLWTIFVVVRSLPCAIVAWTEPDGSAVLRGVPASNGAAASTGRTGWSRRQWALVVGLVVIMGGILTLVNDAPWNPLSPSEAIFVLLLVIVLVAIATRVRAAFREP